MTHFITQSWLTKNGIFNENIDSKLYMPLVPSVAKSFLPKLIGTHFYNDLLTKYNAQTLTSDEEIVVASLQWSIAWRLKADAVIETSLQLTNKGLQLQSDDNSEAASLQQMGERTSKLIQKASSEEMYLTEYLKDNKDLYPEFTSNDNSDSSIKRCMTSFGSEGTGFYII